LLSLAQLLTKKLKNNLLNGENLSDMFFFQSIEILSIW